MPVSTATPDAVPRHARGTRSPFSGHRPPRSRPKIPRSGTATISGGRTVTFSSVDPFRDGLILIVTAETPELKRGSVLVRSRQLARRYGVPEAYAVFRGLFDAMRAFGTHAQEGYRAEAKLLRELTLGELPFAVQLAWNLTGSTPAERKAYEKAMTQIAAKLSRVRDEGKVQAHQKLTLAADPFDVLGRVNPGAKAARVWAANTRLRDRADQVPGLAAHMGTVASHLLVLRSRAWALIADVDLALRAGIRAVGLAQKGNRRIRLDNLAVRLGGLADSLAEKDMDPYGTHAFPHYVRDLREAAAALPDDATKAVRAMDRVLRAIQLLSMQDVVEDALTTVSAFVHRKENIGTRDRNSLERLLEGVRSFLNTHRDIDAGFKNPVTHNLRGSLAKAVAAVRAGKEPEEIVGHLRSAARCF